MQLSIQILSQTARSIESNQASKKSNDFKDLTSAKQVETSVVTFNLSDASAAQAPLVYQPALALAQTQQIQNQPQQAPIIDAEYEDMTPKSKASQKKEGETAEGSKFASALTSRAYSSVASPKGSQLDTYL